MTPGLEVVEPWSRVRTGTDLHELFAAADLGDASITERVHDLPLASPEEDWWRIVMGSGLRSTIGRLDRDAAARVRARCTAEIGRRQTTRLTTTSRYGLAIRD